jgi:Rrf2 family protein
LIISMLKIGKLAQQAIAAASYLAERYSEDGTRVSAAEIADARDLPRPVVAKLLASLSQHGLTTGITGPSGGYQLAKAPEDITLYDIVAAFECMDARPMCPFGPNWCGHGAPCPLHDAIVEACEQGDHFFKSQHLGPFRQTSSKAKKGTPKKS